MRKRTRLGAPKGESDPKDRISELPDEILISILSHLTLKEAAITGTLSKRWQHLWTYVAALDFDANDSLDKIASDTKLRDSERAKYIHWVNRVVRKHGSATLDSLRICFDLNESSKSAVDNWVKFAITKGVKRLELDLLENGELFRDPAVNYVFPYAYLCKYYRLSLLLMKNCTPDTRPMHSFATGLKRLESLSLKCVNLCDGTLDHLLSRCRFLHHLSIHGSGNLLNVKISDSSLALRRLEIVLCLALESIEISNVKLVSLCYLGSAIKLSLSNLPMLNEVSIGEGDSGLENNVFDQLSCCLYQLDALTLDIFRPDDSIKSLAFPVLPKLKQLILKIGAWDDDSLLHFTPLVNACPNLRRFVLQLLWLAPSKRRRKIREAPGFVHKSLRSVEIYGYYGRISDDEVVMHFAKNAVALQDLVVDPRSQWLERAPDMVKQNKIEESARRHAKKQLEPKLPPGVFLVVL